MDGTSLWAQVEAYEDTQQDVGLSGTVIEYERETSTYTYTVHYDPGILPGQTVTDGDVEVEINSVEEVGRRRYMRLFCSARTPAQVIE